MKTSDEILDYLVEYKSRIEERSLMFGGTLMGIEALWTGLSSVENFILHEISYDLVQKAYETIARKYKCGSFTIAGNLEKEVESGKMLLLSASEELIKRLKEVDETLRVLSESRT